MIRNILFVLIIGGMGGVLLNNIIIPALIEWNFLNSSKFLKIFIKPQIQTVIQNKETKLVVEPDFWKDIVKKSLNSVTFVQYLSGGRLLGQSNGLILTNDGFLSVPLNSFPRNPSVIQVFFDNTILKAEVYLKDQKNNIVLLKVEGNDFPIIDFADQEEIILGQSILVLGKKIQVSKIKAISQLGLVKELDQSVLFLDTEKPEIGSIALDSRGKLIGQVNIDKQNRVFVILPDVLKETLKKFQSQEKS